MTDQKPCLCKPAPKPLKQEETIDWEAADEFHRFHAIEHPGLPGPNAARAYLTLKAEVAEDRACAAATEAMHATQTKLAAVEADRDAALKRVEELEVFKALVLQHIAPPESVTFTSAWSQPKRRKESEK